MNLNWYIFMLETIYIKVEDLIIVAIFYFFLNTKIKFYRLLNFPHTKYSIWFD